MKISQRLLSGLLLLQCLLVPAVFAATPPATSTPIQAIPPNIPSTGSKPMMTMVSSKDHTLFGPIYTDFEDLDGDGVIDVTYKPTFTYYGYFDSKRCYSYNTTDSRFDPQEAAVMVSDRSTCTTANRWNGNFMNWATMTRLDVIRRMLYGGKRSSDTTSLTVLERTNLSKDSHSFVKYYRGTDIADYTPFSTADLTKTTGSNANVYAGLSICNRSDTMGEGGNPVIRLAKGNYRMWATVEGTVCEWGSGSLGAKLQRYYQNTAYGNGGIAHEANPPDSTADAAKYGSIGPELTVRVKVCDSGKLETNCAAYGSSTIVYKPRGLFQEFGMPVSGASTARVEFALFTGSYDANLTAGALRRNMGDLNDEVDPTTGRFCHSGSSICSSTLSDGRSTTSGGGIKALDSIVLYGRGGCGDYCDSAVQLPSEMTNGTLPAWGNPIGEMVVQALQYYAGLTSTNPASNTKDTGKGLPVKSWNDPLDTSGTLGAARKSAFGNPICRAMNILALSSSASSFDGDDADSAFATLPNRSRGSLADFTDLIGVKEGVAGTVKSVGSVSGGFGEECSGKTLGSLSSVSGICPEAPAVGGTYKVAGAALYANTNRVRTISSLPPDFSLVERTALRVKTYAASLTGGVARIEAKIPGTTKYVYITPESLWASNSNGKKMPGAMLTFASISSSDRHGAFMVTWNDSLFGGDYDMDIAGFLRYDFVANAASPTGWDIQITTDIVNVGAGWTGTHGFSIMGTVGRDGRYLTHRHLDNGSIMNGAPGYLCGDSTYSTGKVPGACQTSTAWNKITDADYPIVQTFNAKGAEDVALKEPLWYAAKYGSFDSSKESTDLPDAAAKWDARRNDGRSCGGSTGRACSDGDPDGYFLARRPDLLEKQLRDTLEQIVAATNAAPAISSAQLITGSFKYIAEYDPTQNSGSVKAFELNTAGDFSSTKIFDVGERLQSADWTTRQVITNDGDTGKAFRSATTFSTAYDTALRDSVLTVDADKNSLINFLRGDRDNEKPLGNALWRSRSVSNILGPIVNASPWLETKPSARFLAGTFATGTPSYSSFATTNASRPKLLWVGSNDGMLHAFVSDTGEPRISYVPSPLVSRLRTISQEANSVIAGMDGSPFTGDVLVGAGALSTRLWKTYLFSSLGRGGRAFFALDVTDTSSTGMSEGNASSIFKWMFSSDDDSDLGYALSDQVMHPASGQAVPIVRLNNGKFGLLLPNGVESTAKKAFLYILSVDGPDGSSGWTAGDRKIKLATDATTSNGMVGVNWVDLDNNGTADVAYGTDLKGRIWKFDISSTNPADWKSSILSGGVPAPFFEAKSGSTALPITTSPTVSFPPMGGVLVSFGTGKSVLTGDFPDTTKTQRFYTIWDSGITSRALAPSDSSTLVQRTLTRRASDGKLYVSGSKASIDWATKDGWYFAMPDSSEMLLSTPEYRGDVLAFTSVRPPVTTTPESCFSTPAGSLFAVDPVTGLARAGALGTMGGSGNESGEDVIGVASADQKVRFANDTSGRMTSPPPGGGVCPAGYSSLRVVGKTADLNLCFSQGTARIQWREVPGLRTQ